MKIVECKKQVNNICDIILNEKEDVYYLGEKNGVIYNGRRTGLYRKYTL